MAIVVEQVLHAISKGLRAVVMHDGSQLEVDLIGDEARLRAAIGQSLGVEFDFDRVVS